MLLVSMMCCLTAVYLLQVAHLHDYSCFGVQLATDLTVQVLQIPDVKHSSIL